MTKGYGQGREIFIKHKVDRAITAAVAVVAIVLSIIAIAAAVLCVLVVGYNDEVAEVITVNISSAEEFLTAMDDKILNDNYMLFEDIELSAAQLADFSSLKLIGTFNGQGHTLTIAGEMSQPLFSVIDSAAVVKGLRLSGLVASTGVSSLSLLVHTNYGTIENCEVVNSEIVVATEKYAAALAAHNFGIIKNCLVDVTFTGNGNAAGRTHIGGAVAVNYDGAQLLGLLCSATFDGSFAELTNTFFNDGETNDKVGYVVGHSSGEVSGSYALDCAFATTASDIVDGFANAMPSSTLTVDFVRDVLQWSPDIWTMPTAGSLPTLKISW
jgi:hypothetical protein